MVNPDVNGFTKTSVPSKVRNCVVPPGTVKCHSHTLATLQFEYHIHNAQPFHHLKCVIGCIIACSLKQKFDC